jgi:hypothetical protein
VTDPAAAGETAPSIAIASQNDTRRMFRLPLVYAAFGAPLPEWLGGTDAATVADRIRAKSGQGQITARFHAPGVLHHHDMSALAQSQWSPHAGFGGFVFNSDVGTMPFFSNV